MEYRFQMLVLSQDGRESARQTLAVASLSIPLGLIVSTGVCFLAQSWPGDLHPQTHSTAVAMQGMSSSDAFISCYRVGIQFRDSLPHFRAWYGDHRELGHNSLAAITQGWQSLLSHDEQQ